MELYLWWIQKYISGKIAQTSISKLFCIISMFYSRLLDECTHLLLRCSRWNSGRRSFSVKSSTARISSHFAESGTVVFAARCYLPQKYFAICQRTVNRRWIKWAQVGCHVVWKPKMHDDVMLNGVFRICLWLVARELQIPKPIERKIYDQSEIAVRLPSSRDPRATKLQTRFACSVTAAHSARIIQPEHGPISS